MIDLKPLYNRVYATRVVQKEIAPGILAHPYAKFEEKFRTAVIEALGPECTEDIKVGDTIMYRQHIGKEIPEKIDGKQIIMLRESDIDCVILN